MSVKELLAKELENAPEPLLEEVLDFTRFLKNKRDLAGRELAILSESSFSKDWLSPEEDGAWRAL